MWVVVKWRFPGANVLPVPLQRYLLRYESVSDPASLSDPDSPLSNLHLPEVCTRGSESPAIFLQSSRVAYFFNFAVFFSVEYNIIVRWFEYHLCCSQGLNQGREFGHRLFRAPKMQKYCITAVFKVILLDKHLLSKMKGPILGFVPNAPQHLNRALATIIQKKDAYAFFLYTL